MGDSRPVTISHRTLYQHVTCLGIRALQGLDAVIASERGGDWGGGDQGRGTVAGKPGFGRQDDWVQGGPVEGRASRASRAATQNTSHL